MIPGSEPTSRSLRSRRFAENPCTTGALLAGFRSPPAAFRPAPFYWWAGESLTRERIAWQLDRLKEKGIRQVIVGYPHGPDGATDPGDPPLFSCEWWKLFRWFLSQCREREMTAGFQDTRWWDRCSGKLVPARRECAAAKCAVSQPWSPGRRRWPCKPKPHLQPSVPGPILWQKESLNPRKRLIWRHSSRTARSCGTRHREAGW